jgi:acyl-coenzyme A synthetase/AMP-(fatty) acid ligase
MTAAAAAAAGDGAKLDADGYFWITGRVDDVINVSGHRWGAAGWVDKGVAVAVS